MTDATQHQEAWPLFASLRGWRMADLGGDVAAGLTLAAIAVPEQMATARLAGFAPELGLFVFVAGSVAFAIFGANRYLSSGADSTIAPIFAGTLGLLAVPGSSAYTGLAAGLALAVGAIMVVAGLARLGWIASFLSIPVTTGFLAGIAVHIVVSQLPELLGIPSPGGDVVARAIWIATHLGETRPLCVVIGALVFALAVGGERLRWPVPGALAGLAVAMLAVWALGDRAMAVVGAAPIAWPHPALPPISRGNLGNLATLALIIAFVTMVQTAATLRATLSAAQSDDVARDFIGVGAGNLLAGALGLFPVNASPPRTAAVEAASGRSQLAGILAAGSVVLLATYGAFLLRYLPLAALAGVLLAIALRIARPATISQVLGETPAEFALILATLVAIVVLPIQTGVVVGIMLSLLHGLWTISRTRLIEFERVPGTSVWWPPSQDAPGEKLPDVRVVAFQAPLSFLNADEFRRDMIEVTGHNRPRLIVLEASGVAEIDFTAAQTLIAIISRCTEANVRFAIARLTSVRAQKALVRFGVAKKLGPNGIFHSVDEAIRTLAPAS